MNLKSNLVAIGAVVLILIFSLPTWIGLFALISGQFNGDAPLGRQFAVMLLEPSPAWDYIRTGLVAAVAAIAGLGLSDKLEVRAMVVVAGLAVALAPLLVLFIYLLDPRNGAPLWEVLEQDFLTDQIGREGFYRAWNSYLTGQFQVIAAQLALFLGLQARTEA